jgi:hypothetical protein
VVILVTCIFGFAAAAFLTRTLIAARKKPLTASQQPPQHPSKFFRDGFAFDKLRGEDNNWKGPSFGEKIDLAQLRGKDNTSHPSPGKTQLLMIVFINPACKMCEVATDEMSHVRDKVALLGIPYYVVSLVPLENSHAFFEYCDSLNLGVPTFMWSTKEQPLTSLSTMVAPSHLLLDHNGVIIRTWPGSNEDQAFRIRMAKQIVDDTSVIVETLAALSKRSTSNNEPEESSSFVLR